MSPREMATNPPARLSLASSVSPLRSMRCAAATDVVVDSLRSNSVEVLVVLLKSAAVVLTSGGTSIAPSSFPKAMSESFMSGKFVLGGLVVVTVLVGTNAIKSEVVSDALVSGADVAIITGVAVETAVLRVKVVVIGAEAAKGAAEEVVVVVSAIVLVVLDFSSVLPTVVDFSNVSPTVVDRIPLGVEDAVAMDPEVTDPVTSTAVEVAVLSVMVVVVEAVLGTVVKIFTVTPETTSLRTESDMVTSPPTACPTSSSCPSVGRSLTASELLDVTSVSTRIAAAGCCSTLTTASGTNLATSF
mmetsp:Transcript_84445/g.159026  ORF Transcript_84445/g.159026 Transcript_84445/m.159026 type:complete len:301 (+) Transcript_84445:1491-2393(+)